MAYSENKKFETKKLGGPGRSVESDVFQLGKKTKNGLGFKLLNKAAIHFVGERGGDICMEPYPNPRGGSEALHQISTLLDKLIAPKTQFHSDNARGQKAWVADREDLDLYHFIVNHSESKDHGFTWICWIDEEDGEIFDTFDGENTLITCSTQMADGMAANVKRKFIERGGIKREHVRSEIKEIQWKSNNANKDLYLQFLQDWGDLE